LRYRLSLPAEETLVDIRARGLIKWGVIVADRYDLLLDTAIADLSDDPYLAGSKSVPRAPSVFVYPIRLSRTHVSPQDRIHDPRPLIVYRVGTDSVLEIRGVVHDRVRSIAGAARRAARSAVFRAPSEDE
jgi:plasmid stabilization system protein ParE